MKKVDLTFLDFMEKIDDLGKGEWITVYEHHAEKSENFHYYCALMKIKRADEALGNTSWEFRIGEGLPGYSLTTIAGKEVISYYHHQDRSIEPFVIYRQFDGMKPDYFEISEEFRFFFNLYEDRPNRKYIIIDEGGDDEDVILISDKKVQVKSRLIKQFLTIRKMRLALFFEINRFSDQSLEQLGLTDHQEIKRGKDFIFSIGTHSWDAIPSEACKSLGRLLGKKLISGPKHFKPVGGRSGKKYVDFIIGLNETGEEILHTCNEDELANFFGKNKEHPNYLTPVLFRKDVLTKYYSQPSKYSVEDGLLRCGGLWILEIDNNQPDYVMVFLGDLGHLTFNEQLHLRSFNVAAEKKMSRTAWRRGFEAQFTAPEKSDLFFKEQFSTFQAAWKKKFGWDLFRPLSHDDNHYDKTLRIPLTNEQTEFDQQVLALTKIIIDSLNEEELQKDLAIEKANPKGLDKLEAFLKSKNNECPDVLEFLRNLQSLRSSGVAHRKGKNYQKVKTFFLIDGRELSKVFDEILKKCIWMLKGLNHRFLTNSNQ